MTTLNHSHLDYLTILVFEGQQQVAAEKHSFLRNIKQIFSSYSIISAFILISLSSSSPSCVALMGLNPAGSLPVFFGARRRCRFWHLRSCGLLRRRLNSELHENGWRWQCQLVRDAPRTPPNNHRSLSKAALTFKAQSTMNKTVTSGHGCRECLGGKCWSRISPRMFSCCEFFFVHFENLVAWTWLDKQPKPRFYYGH